MPEPYIEDEPCTACSQHTTVCAICFRCDYLWCGCDSALHEQFDAFVKDHESEAQDMQNILTNWYELFFGDQ